MRVAIVHSWLNQYGGAERVLETLHQLYPSAPIYTSMYAPAVMPKEYRNWDIRPSFMDSWPWVKTHHQLFFWAYPFAFEQFDLSGYDVVVSNSSAYCHGVITRPETLHVCYCLTPARFLWDYPQYIRRERVGLLARRLLPFLLNYLRTWDALAANRVDYFVAISQNVAARIAKYYRRQAAIIHPPVDTSAYRPSDHIDDFYLVVSRLIPYKRIDLAVRAFNELGLTLKVVGDGRDRGALQKMAKPNIEFLGRLPDAATKDLYSRCRALIFPGEEDFGLSPLEAHASGRPVIAYRAGGALETVVEGVTGLFFDEPVPESLAQAVRQFDPGQYDPTVIRRRAEEFDIAVFRKKLDAFISAKYAQRVRPGEQACLPGVGDTAETLRTRGDR